MNLKPHLKYNEYLTIGEEIYVYNSLKDAIWKAAIQDEIFSLYNLNTWKLANLPEGRKPICQHFLSHLSRVITPCTVVIQIILIRGKVRL